MEFQTSCFCMRTSFDHYISRCRLFGHSGACSACGQSIPASEMVMRAQGNVYHLKVSLWCNNRRRDHTGNFSIKKSLHSLSSNIFFYRLWMVRRGNKISIKNLRQFGMQHKLSGNSHKS